MPKRKKKSWKERLREKQIKHQRAIEAYRIQRERESIKKPKQKLVGKLILAFCLLSIIIFGAYGVWQHTRLKGDTQQQPTQTPLETGTIYILANGTVHPATAPISKKDNWYYTFKTDIKTAIIIQRDNIIIDGAGHTLQGGKIPGSKGIDLTGRNNVTVKNLNIKGFDYGIYLHSTSCCSISRNNFTENYCNIWITYSSNNEVTSNTITNTTLNEGYGIWLKNSAKNALLKNSITLQTYAIYIGFSDHNMISTNQITNNNKGVYLYNSANNTILKNNMTKNMSGIELLQSQNNIIKENSITNNNIGIGIDKSQNNRIYNNNFINNTHQVLSNDSTNTWDGDHPLTEGSGGNYWSDYKERYPNALPDTSGVWKEPYIIDDKNKDKYPLINPKQ
ncbi:MAG: NosD domain-containing protein [Candidatus Bathyarchaeia archaeon]